MALAPVSKENPPKSALVKFLQRKLGRALTKSDVVYELQQLGDALCVSTVRLPCLVGISACEFTGEPHGSQKEAEQSAAQMALHTFAEEIATMPSKAKQPRDAPVKAEGNTWCQTPGQIGIGDSLSKDAKTRLCETLQAILKRAMTKGDICYEQAVVQDEAHGIVSAKVVLACLGGQEFFGDFAANLKSAQHAAAEVALAQRATWWLPGPGASVPAVGVKRPAVKIGVGGTSGAVPAKAPGQPPAAKKAKATGAQSDAKTRLTMFLQGCFRRALTKADVSYTFDKFEAETGMMFQAQVTLTCAQAVAHSDPTWAKGVTFVGMPGASQKEAEKNAAQVALDAYAAEVAAAGAKAPAGPAVRTLLADAANLTGHVAEWKANYGWILPDWLPDNHVALAKQGNIFVSVSDVQQGSLEVGDRVRFDVYADNKGLGAANVCMTL